MRSVSSLVANEHGSALIFAILILAMLTIIGVASTNTSTMESMISGNDTVAKVAFQQADGGSESGIELVEQNIESSGFDTNDTSQIPGIHVNASHLNFYLNDPPAVDGATGVASRTEADLDTYGDSSTGPDAYLPKNATETQPHTSLAIGGQAKLATGAAIQMIAGYEGKGKGSAGGVHVLYDIWSKRKDVKNSEAVVRLQWRHVI